MRPKPLTTEQAMAEFAERGPVTDPVLLSRAVLARAGDALFDVLRTRQLRDHPLQYQAIKRAWSVLTALYGVSLANEEPVATDAKRTTEIGGTT